MIMAKQYSDKTNAIIYAVIGCGLLIWALLGYRGSAVFTSAPFIIAVIDFIMAGFYAVRRRRSKIRPDQKTDGNPEA
jgi:hypothetical protein